MENCEYSIGVAIHGVPLVLKSNHLPLIEYAKEHLNGLATPQVEKPKIEVHCLWSRGDWQPETNPFSSNGALNVIGKRMLGNRNELIWLNTLKMKGLQLRFRQESDRYLFEVAYKFHPKKEKLDHLPEYAYKKYFSLMSYLVYYPVTWYLETFRNWTVLHASALSYKERGVMIGGLGGVGKTTTCMALVQYAGARLISENIIFTDGAYIYPFNEPIRLNAESLELLANGPEQLRPMKFPEGLKEKWLFHLDSKYLPQKVEPTALFLPQFASHRYVQGLPYDLAAEKILAINRLTRELDDYGWYAAALDMTWPHAGQAYKRIEAIRRLTEKADCFELGIDRTAGPQAVVEDILRRVY